MAATGEIQIGRISRFLTKWASTKGQSPVMTLGAEIVPILHIFSGIEDRYLHSWQTYGLQNGQAAVAAQNATFKLRNPAGSNIVVAILSLQVGSLLADQPFLIIQPSIVDLGTITPNATSRMDARGPQQPMSIVSHGTTAALPATVQRGSQFGANGNYEFVLHEDQEMCVLPGDALQVFSNVVNQATNFSVMWRERVLEPSEVT